MQVAEARIKDFYRSGFPKEVQRNKHNLQVNERLKKARNFKEMSTARVVKELQKQGISIGHSTLQGYEANEASLNHRYPSLPVLYALSDFYDVSIDYLFGLTDTMERVTKRIPKNDLKQEIKHNPLMNWNGRVLTEKQRELITAQIEFLLNRG